MNRVNARAAAARRAPLALALLTACSSSPGPRAAAGTPAAAGGGRVAARPRAPDLPWLTGSWRTSDGTAVEHWTAIGDALVGVGFGGDAKATRSFEVMVVSAEGDKLVFTGRPNGGAAVAFPEESREARAIAFANPAHDDPKRVTYRADGEQLVAATEGPKGRQEWRLSRVRAASVPAIEEAAAARGDRAVSVSVASAAGDAGFSIARDQRDRDRVTVWRRDEAGRWVAVFDLFLTG